MLLMSDELAQDEENMEDYDLNMIERQINSILRRHEDDEATLVGGRSSAASINEDSVVFEIGDEDDNADECVGFLNGGPRSRRRDD